MPSSVQAASLVVPVTLVGSIVATAVGVAWWLSGHFGRIEIGFAEMKHELQLLRYQLDGSVQDGEMVVWVSELRAQNPTIHVPAWH